MSSTRRAPGANKTPHRPKRDGQKAHETTLLKRENNYLRRQLNKLKREIDRLDLLNVRAEDFGEIAFLTDVEPEAPKCPDCGAGNLLEVPTPSGKVLKGCRACSWRN